MRNVGGGVERRKADNKLCIYKPASPWVTGTQSSWKMVQYTYVRIIPGMGKGAGIVIPLLSSLIS